MSNKNKVLSGGLAILVLAELVAKIVYYVELQPVQSFAQPAHTVSVEHILSTCAALAACADTALAFSIVILLHRSRSKIPFSRTSSMIDRIMMYTVGSGLLTAAFAFAGLVAFLTMKTNLVYILLLEMLPKREATSYNLSIH